MKYFIVIACCLAAFATASRAESQNYLIFHGASKHVHPENKQYQESNIGLGYRKQSNRTSSIQYGTYLNSHDKLTFYYAKQHTPVRFAGADLGWFYGVGTGYKIPLSGGLMLNYYHGEVVYTVRHVPRIAGNSVQVTTFEMGFRF